jgi:PadR family transcriptional regulator PadR
MTLQVLTVLDALLGNEERYGFELCQMTGQKSGTLYPILARLERAGWVTSGWENDSVRLGPRRRYYRLTGVGAGGAAEHLAKVPGRAPPGRPAREPSPSCGSNRLAWGSAR